MLDIGLIGRRIRELRREKGLTQNDLAGALCVSFQAISNWERGVAPPDLDNLVRIASFFGVLVDELLRAENGPFFLGIDGGGTKTEFAVVSCDGHVVRRFVKGGCNPNDVGYAKTLALICEGISEVLLEFQSLRSVFCGIAGITAGNYAERLETDLKKAYPKLKAKIKSDSFNLFAMDESAAMAVISGTGSVVFVREGESYRRLGGWGYLLDRAGSAYDIGLAVLREALREEDAGEVCSCMSELLLERLGTASVWEHLNTVYREGKPYIASLASVAFEAYRRGDEGAARIIDQNARALAELLNLGVMRYGAEPIAVASGGLFLHHTDVMRSYIEKYSRVRLNVCKLPPVYGACRAACLMELAELPDGFFEHFERTYEGENE